jgi:hypothetical protein
VTFLDDASRRSRRSRPSPALCSSSWAAGKRNASNPTRTDLPLRALLDAVVHTTANPPARLRTPGPRVPRESRPVSVAAGKLLRYGTCTCTCTCRKVAEAGPLGQRIAHPLPLPSAFPPEAPQKALRTRLPAERPAPSSQLAARSSQCPAPKVARSSQLPARGRESKSSGLSRGIVPDGRGRKKVRPGPFNPPSSPSPHFPLICSAFALTYIHRPIRRLLRTCVQYIDRSAAIPDACVQLVFCHDEGRRSLAPAPTPASATAAATATGLR